MRAFDLTSAISVMLITFLTLIFLGSSELLYTGDIVNLHYMFELNCNGVDGGFRNYEIMIPTIAHFGFICGFDGLSFQKLFVGINILLFSICALFIERIEGRFMGLFVFLAFLLILDFWILGHFFRQLAALAISIILFIGCRNKICQVFLFCVAFSLHSPTAVICLFYYCFLTFDKKTVIYCGLFLLAFFSIFAVEIFSFLKSNYGTIFLERGVEFRSSASANSITTLAFGVFFGICDYLNRHKLTVLVAGLGICAVYALAFLLDSKDEFFVRIYLYYKYSIFLYGCAQAGRMFLKSFGTYKRRVKCEAMSG